MNIIIKFYEFLSYGNYTPLTKYTIDLASCGILFITMVASLAIVFTFESVIFTKNNILAIYFLDTLYIHKILKYIL